MHWNWEWWQLAVRKMGRVNVRNLQHEVSRCKMKPKDVKHTIMKKYPWEKLFPSEVVLILERCDYTARGCVCLRYWDDVGLPSVCCDYH